MRFNGFCGLRRNQRRRHFLSESYIIDNNLAPVMTELWRLRKRVPDAEARSLGHGGTGGGPGHHLHRLSGDSGAEGAIKIERGSGTDLRWRTRFPPFTGGRGTQFSERKSQHLLEYGQRLRLTSR